MTTDTIPIPIAALRYRSARVAARAESLPSPFRADPVHAIKVAAALVLNAVLFGFIIG